MLNNQNCRVDRHQKKGFTLIEMLVVIGVILILVGIAVPSFMGAMARARITQAKTYITELKGTIAAYNTDTRQWPESGSEFLYYVLSGISPFSSRSSKRYNPPYMEFDGTMAGKDTYARIYGKDITAIELRPVTSSGQGSKLKYIDIQNQQAEQDYGFDWKPLIDPWSRPIIYISPDDLKKTFNGERTQYSSLVALDSEQAVNDKGKSVYRPYGINSGQLWSAGPDGLTSKQGKAGFDQPGNLSGSDQRDNDNDGLSDASDLKAGGGNTIAEDDINSW
jgi:prepilin-type N-terminal cleavage/methylation domain-containing protein